MSYQETAQITVDNSDALVDDVITITVHGLGAGQRITLRAQMQRDGRTFGACAWFTADDNGVIILARDASTGGTYEGISPMGLFWSMKSAPDQPYGLRLLVRNASFALICDIAAFPGHVNFAEVFNPDHVPMCTRSIRRWYMSRGVQKTPVRQGRLRGTMFIPPGRGPFPGVIDMFGTAGGSIEFRAALLASRGYATFALAYMRYQDLPLNISDVNFEYFIEAVEWFARQEHVDSENIGAIGVSKGGEIALHMAYFTDKIKAAVSINGAPFFTHVPMMYRNSPLGQSIFSKDNVILTDEGILTKDMMDCEIEKYLPIWKKDVNVLLINGANDECLHPKILRTLYDLYPGDRKHLCQLYAYKDAGHLIEPPYAPLARVTKKQNETVADHEKGASIPT
ncbi:acyl-coenzyme A thioesterase 1-like isoform X2 [Dreissena polymorpha]|uniref:acyl-coenzyme A thioesterase 1-like isoform X2 n=1 Tax=Dreissena polymorpha TaxID=45954 RepID=UPI002263EDC9|nr:acyl-coenzyme A thioesterase 1-like isoform X2 [Dreissena polymorpha]